MSCLSCGGGHCLCIVSLVPGKTANVCVWIHAPTSTMGSFVTSVNARTCCWDDTQNETETIMKGVSWLECHWPLLGQSSLCTSGKTALSRLNASQVLKWKTMFAVKVLFSVWDPGFIFAGAMSHLHFGKLWWLLESLVNVYCARLKHDFPHKMKCQTAEEVIGKLAVFCSCKTETVLFFFSLWLAPFWMTTC